jgi:formate dehydrogenase subunit beta
LALADEVGLSAETDEGEQVLENLGIESDIEPPGRTEQITRLLSRRRQEREAFLKQTAEKINTIEKFQKYFANCLNCYNCRMACPVCYCKECVFMTDVFDHEPETLLRRAGKKGMLKLPAETSMFHLTRMAHMSHSCVGCGQCSSVCPSDIPVADVFSKVAAEIQALYDYEPGRDTEEPLPLLVFEEDDT